MIGFKSTIIYNLPNPYLSFLFIILHDICNHWKIRQNINPYDTFN